MGGTGCADWYCSASTITIKPLGLFTCSPAIADSVSMATISGSFNSLDCLRNRKKGHATFPRLLLEYNFEQHPSFDSILHPVRKGPEGFHICLRLSTPAPCDLMVTKAFRKEISPVGMPVVWRDVEGSRLDLDVMNCMWLGSNRGWCQFCATLLLLGWKQLVTSCWMCRRIEEIY